MITKYNKTQVRSHIELTLCIRCGQEASHFKSCIALKSYNNTGLCQRCQDLLKKGEVNGSTDNREVKTDGKNN
jgi:hypothetical protein